MKIKYGFLIVVFLMSCTSPNPGKRTPNSQNYVDESLDTYLGEEAEPNEDESIQRVIDEGLRALKRDFPKPTVPRDAHAKSHGCLRASFEVNNSNLPPYLRVGLFEKNEKYDAWVRFSNNTSDPMSNDKDLDLRGIAIKVMGVKGQKILENELDEETQDFLMFASPIFFIKDIKDYAEFIKALGDGRAVRHLAHRPKTLIQLATAQLKARRKTNPLKLNYFSAVPYRLGLRSHEKRRQVKYSVAACDKKALDIEPDGDRSHPNFMREALKESLSHRDACFDFQLQAGHPRNLDAFPVEDPSIFWNETPSQSKVGMPYLKVATLRIPAQNFDTPDLDAFCERLSFTPWHALPEHRPLGRTNRMRRKVYDAISNYRHDANGVKKVEPKTLDPLTAFK